MSSSYRPIRRMAIGGMAEVLLASKLGLGGFERLVVIKRILPHLREEQEFVQMFLDEARLAANFHHPNIVETLDVYRDGETFGVALEYISGEDLRYLIGRARKREITIPVPAACRMVADIASALDYIHNATDAEGTPLKVIHRDVAPSNILLSYNGVAKLIDFGIAKAQISHIYTRPGTLKGKFAYMSPEQIGRKTLDGRSDVFSLSIVLHELLTGRRLFKGPSQAAVLKSVMEREVPPPSQVNPAVPKELDRLVLEGLRRKRSERIPHAGELYERLEGLLGGDELPFTGAKQVSRWLDEALAERKVQRATVEREVVFAAREPEYASEHAQGASTEDLPMPSLFSASGRGTVPSHTPGTPASTSASEVQPVAGATGVQEERGRPVLWLTLGVAVTLVVLGAVIIGFLLGRTDKPEVASEQPKTQATAEATVVVHVLPGGSRLYVNGVVEPREVGPEGVMVTRPGGSKLALRVVKDGYGAHTSSVELPKTGTQHLHVHLEKEAVGAVNLAAANEAATGEARPSNGKRSTKRRASLPRRRHRPAASTKSRRQTPKRAALLLAFAPPNATVLLDGLAKAGTSPMRLEGLPPGAHKVTVRASGHVTATRTVHLKAGGEASVDLRLAPQAPRVATLDIVTTPGGASITVNGKAKGRSPVLGLQLPPDRTYRIEATLAGHKRWTTQVTPSAGRNPPVVGSLNPLRVARASTPSPSVAEITVPRSMKGSVSRGAQLVQSKCGSCHKVSSRRYTAAQWNRYFANGRHKSNGPFRGSFSRAELAAVKSFLMSKAADVEGDVAAGVR